MLTPKNIILNDAFKQFTLDQDKIISPRQTIEGVKRKFETIDLDILSHTTRIDNGRLDIPVYFSVCGKDAARLCGTNKQMGKGATPEQAEASATMELVERFSFFSFFNNPDNFIVDRYKNIKNKALPAGMIADSVHDNTDDQDKAWEIFENLVLKWTWGFNLTQDRPVLVPFDWFYTINEFNGTSAGNCAEEALCQGICEVVERHVSSITSRKQLELPRIDPKSATDPMVIEMLKKYDREGIRLWISDFTLDMGIPTVGVLAYDPATFPEKSEIVWTAGTAASPEKALSRALTETAQLAGDFNSGANYVASGLPKFSSIEDAGFIINSQNTVDIDRLPDISHDNIRVEIERCIKALAADAYEVLTVDTTHLQLKIPAFYSIIPGAHFRERAQNTSLGMFSTKLIAEQSPPQEAIFELMQIDERMPGKYYLKFFIGRCHLMMGRNKEALKYFETAIELEPNPQDAAAIYSYMGVCLKEMERFREALAVLEKGRRLDSRRTDIHNLMGFCHYKLKSHDEAIVCFKKVIALDPSSAIDYANIASNYRELGEREKAVHYYKTALSIDPTIEFAQAALDKLAHLF